MSSPPQQGGPDDSDTSGPDDPGDRADGMALSGAAEEEESKPPRTVHDALFKSVFGDPKKAAAVLGSILPPEVSRHINWPTLKPIRASVVSTGFKQNHGDLWFEVSLKNGRPALLWVLYEHQRDPDRWMSLRFLEAIAKLLRERLDRNPEARRLPAIIPVVLYQGTRPWKEPTSLQELFDLPDEAKQDLARLLPSCSFVLDDLAVAADEEIVARPLDSEARLALIVMKHATARDLAESLGRLVSDIRALIATEHGKRRWEFLLDYVWYNNPHVGLDELMQALCPAASPEVNDSMLTYGQRLEQQGQRTVLLHMLQRRFGELPEAVTRQLDEAGAAELKRWSDRILYADSLDELMHSPTAGPEANGSTLTYGQRLAKQNRENGERSVLLRLLKRRFGELPAAVTRRINTATAAELEQWSDRILDADSLDAVFAP